MKKFKQLLGITMLSSAFMALFIMTSIEYGAIEAVKGWSIAIGSSALIWGGIYLLFGNDK